MNGSCNVDAKRFAATETGTRLKEMCGVDSTKFNAITALVYNPNTDSGFTKEFDDYRKTDDIAKDAMFNIVDVANINDDKIGVDIGPNTVKLFE